MNVELTNFLNRYDGKEDFWSRNLLTVDGKWQDKLGSTSTVCKIWRWIRGYHRLDAVNNKLIEIGNDIAKCTNDSGTLGKFKQLVTTYRTSVLIKHNSQKWLWGHVDTQQLDNFIGALESLTRVKKLDTANINYNEGAIAIPRDTWKTVFSHFRFKDNPKVRLVCKAFYTLVRDHCPTYKWVRHFKHISTYRSQANSLESPAHLIPIGIDRRLEFSALSPYCHYLNHKNDRTIKVGYHWAVPINSRDILTNDGDSLTRVDTLTGKVAWTTTSSLFECVEDTYAPQIINDHLALWSKEIARPDGLSYQYLYTINLMNGESRLLTGLGYNDGEYRIIGESVLCFNYAGIWLYQLNGSWIKFEGFDPLVNWKPRLYYANTQIASFVLSCRRVPPKIVIWDINSGKVLKEVTQEDHLFISYKMDIIKVAKNSPLMIPIKEGNKQFQLAKYNPETKSLEPSKAHFDGAIEYILPVNEQFVFVYANSLDGKKLYLWNFITMEFAPLPVELKAINGVRKLKENVFYVGIHTGIVFLDFTRNDKIEATLLEGSFDFDKSSLDHNLLYLHAKASGNGKQLPSLTLLFKPTCFEAF